jgi:hypothetical protein
MATKIDGLRLPETLGAALGGSPEDAAKAFLAAASAGISKVLRDAIMAAVGETVGGAAGGAPPDWTKFITGLVCDLQWDVPPGTQQRTIVSFAGPPEAALGSSIEVSVAITVKF